MRFNFINYGLAFAIASMALLLQVNVHANPVASDLKLKITKFSAIVEPKNVPVKNPQRFVNLQWQSISTRSALHIIAKLSGMNMVVSDKVNGDITVHLAHVTWSEALNTILKIKNLASIKEGNVLYVASRTAIENLKKQSLDVNSQQIIIHARIVNLDKHFEQALGIRWGVHDHGSVQADDATHTQNQPQRLFNLDLPYVSPVSSFNLGFTLVKLAHDHLLDLELAALESEGVAKIIAAPRLMTDNHKQATIESGEEIPYQQISLSGGTAVTFKKAVLSLKVTPVVTPDHKIRLKLYLNQDRRGPDIGQGIPAIDTRQLTTEVVVANRQTVVLGGIFQHSYHDALESVPFLGSIPGIGHLFRYKKKIKRQTELLIFVTPEIVK